MEGELAMAYLSPQNAALDRISAHLGLSVSVNFVVWGDTGDSQSLSLKDSLFTSLKTSYGTVKHWYVLFNFLVDG